MTYHFPECVCRMGMIVPASQVVQRIKGDHTLNKNEQKKIEMLLLGGWTKTH